MLSVFSFCSLQSLLDFLEHSRMFWKINKKKVGEEERREGRREGEGKEKFERVYNRVVENNITLILNT